MKNYRKCRVIVAFLFKNTSAYEISYFINGFLKILFGYTRLKNILYRNKKNLIRKLQKTTNTKYEHLIFLLSFFATEAITRFFDN